MQNIIDSSFDLNLTFVISAISPCTVSVRLHVLSISTGLWPEVTGRITLFYIKNLYHSEYYHSPETKYHEYHEFYIIIWCKSNRTKSLKVRTHEKTCNSSC